MSPDRRMVLAFFLLGACACPAPGLAQPAPPDTAITGTFALREWTPATLELAPYSLDGNVLHAVKRRMEADRGTLEVPERRDGAGARMLELPVVRVRATGARPGAPVFWFEGGPGQSNMYTLDFDYLLERHDHVMVGYRGVDGSVSLDCPEVSAVLRSGADVLAEATLQRVGDAYAACAERLQGDGVDLDGYTIVDVVKDVESARRALGYDSVVVVGESYGTRLATSMRSCIPKRSSAWC